MTPHSSNGSYAVVKGPLHGSGGPCQVVLPAQDFADLSASILERGNGIRFQARGGSMLPLIRHRDVLTAQPVSQETLRVGDIVLHRIGRDRVVAHRILRLRRVNGKVMLTTRGDACFSPGDRVSAEQVLGHVVALRRGGRFVRLDRGARRVAGVLWMRLWPIGPALLRAIRPAVRLCRRIGLGDGRPLREQHRERE